jgi:hypothetical protein
MDEPTSPSDVELKYLPTRVGGEHSGWCSHSENDKNGESVFMEVTFDSFCHVPKAANTLSTNRHHHWMQNWNTYRLVEVTSTGDEAITSKYDMRQRKCQLHEDDKKSL